MTTTAQAILLSGGRAPFDGVMREQFVFTSPGCPYGPRPYAKDNIFFGDEADVLMREFGAAKVRQWLQPVLDMGANTIHTGPLVARGYDGQYPATRWVGHANEWADTICQLAEWFPKIHLVAWPDDSDAECRRYYNVRNYALGNGSPLGDLTGDFEPLFFHPQIQSLMARGVIEGQDQWEQAPFSREKQQLFSWMWGNGSGPFANVPRRFHNPWGHMWPGDGSEGEYECTAICIAHGMTGLALQVHPLGMNPSPMDARPIDWIIQERNEPQRTWVERAIYDCWDGQRRALGVDNAPWVMPNTVTGQRPDVIYAEWTAWGCYNGWVPTSIGREARQQLQKTVGANFGIPLQFLDGL